MCQLLADAFKLVAIGHTYNLTATISNATLLVNVQLNGLKRRSIKPIKAIIYNITEEKTKNKGN
jgi:hypothetical protein